MGLERRKAGIRILAALAVAAGIFCLFKVETPQTPKGSGQLFSIQELPDNGAMCLPESASDDPNLIAELEKKILLAAFPIRPVYAAFGNAAFPIRPVYAAFEDVGGTTALTRPPVRTLLDTAPGYVAVAVNARTGEVFLQDSNTWSILVFNRLENTPPSAARTEPKRLITGPASGIQYNSQIYIDPNNGDIYSVENDTGDQIVVFSQNADGDAKPLRKLKVGHRAYGMAVDEGTQELYVSVQSPPQVEVYRKIASGDEKPLRLIQGKSTRLSDSHGIAIDPKNKLLFVNNWGSVSRLSGPDSADYNVAAGGRFEPPSIAVFPLDANGDAAPVRVIQGPKTQLNWPGTMSLDPETGDLYVANDAGQSILVFRGTARGDAAPARVLKGRSTGLNYPLGVNIDTKNKELWVANFGNSSATVYPLSANGNMAPLRTIRSAQPDKVSLKLGKLNVLAYDSKREEILVPN